MCATADATSLVVLHVRVFVRREAARASMLADTVRDDDLAAVEDAFFKSTGLTDTQGLAFLAKRRAVAAGVNNNVFVAAEQQQDVSGDNQQQQQDAPQRMSS